MWLMLVNIYHNLPYPDTSAPIIGQCMDFSYSSMNHTVQLSWSKPSVAADCCVSYVVEVFNGSGGKTDKLNFPVQLNQEENNVSVHCLDSAGVIGPSDTLPLRAGMYNYYTCK